MATVLTRTHAVFIAIFIIFSSLHSIFAIESTGIFRGPSDQTNERIRMIQVELFKIQTELLSLRTAFSSDESFLILQTRISALEVDFLSIKQTLADEQRRSSDTNGKFENTIATLINYYNTLDNQLGSLQLSMDNKAKEDAARRLPMDIAEAVRSHRFAAAELLLLNLPNYNEKIPLIVNEVYAHSQGNTDVLLDFSRALNRTDLKYDILRALKYEMQANGHRDPFKLILLAKTLDSAVLGQKNISTEVKMKALRLSSETDGNITSAATETLRAAIYSNRYQKNVQVEALAIALDDFRPAISEEVMKRVVSESYPAVSAVTLADCMNSNKRISQIVSGLATLFWKMESVNDLNNKAVLSIAEYLKAVQKSPYYVKLEPTLRDQVCLVIQKMPTCAKNLFFARAVCLWNVGRAGYLYASKYKWNPDRRRVFTWGPGQFVRQAPWFVEKSGEKFYFRNLLQNNEYLYAAMYKRDKDRRYVMTWVNGGGIDSDQYAWNVEINSNHCYIKNVQFNEYLFTSNYEFNRDRKYAVTWVPGTSVRQPEFQWEIRAC